MKCVVKHAASHLSSPKQEEDGEGEGKAVDKEEEGERNLEEPREGEGEMGGRKGTERRRRMVR